MFAVRDLGLARFLRDNFSLAVNPARFRPTHDLGQLLAWGLFADHPAWHHLMRLLMKLAAFAALAAVAVREVERAGARPLDAARRLPMIALAAALFLYFPNNPEARLSPQELAAVMYFMAVLLLLDRRKGAWRDGACVLCFTLALWCKEPNFIVATPLLAVILVEAARPGDHRMRRMACGLACLAVWTHEALKASVMNAGGHGRSALSWLQVQAMLREAPHQLLLSGSGAWVPAVFVTGVTLFVALGLGPGSPRGRLRSGLPLWMLLSSLAQWLLMWSPVLRYAFPTAALLVLTAVCGFGLLLARLSGPRALAVGGVAVSALSVLFAAAHYRDMVLQFSAQHVSGRTEQAVLGAVERMASGPAAPAILGEGEYEYRMGAYFNRHRPYFTGRAMPVTVLRTADEVAPGGLVVGRKPSRPGFEEVLRVPPAPPSRLVFIAEAISGLVRPAVPADAVALDAGAEPYVTWFVLRRIRLE